MRPSIELTDSVAVESQRGMLHFVRCCTYRPRCTDRIATHSLPATEETNRTDITLYGFRDALLGVRQTDE